MPLEPFEQPNREELPRHLEELEEDLYSRNLKTGETPRTKFRIHGANLNDDWEPPKKIPKIEHRGLSPEQKVSLFKKFFIGAAVFFVIAFGISLYVFFAGSNTISAENVAIAVGGPTSVGGGEILSLDVTISNQNNTTLLAPDLLIEYPDGTKSPSDLSLDQKRYREALGDLKPGESATRKVGAVLFGGEGENKDITVAVEYRVAGSSAIFHKETIHRVAISSTPITMTIDMPKEATTGQEMNVVVDIVSNSNTVIKNAMLVADYPFGFDFGSASPSPDFSSNIWLLGDLAPGAHRTVKVHGAVSGQEGDQRTIRFSVGTQSSSNEHTIATTFLSSNQIITITKPSVGLVVALNGDTTDPYVTRSGKNVRVDLSWANNTNTKMTNMQVVAALSGSIFDSFSILPTDGGYYRSPDGTITWDQTLKSDLKALDPAGSGRTGFSFNLISFAGSSSFPKNPEMTISMTMKGKRFNEANVPEDVLSTVTRTIKLSTDLALSTRALYASGPFRNSGPLPPRANIPTTYTIVWSLTNTVNDLSGVVVTANLPSYVEWLGAAAPSGEKISYNPIGGQVEWDAGDVAAGTGFAGSPREVYFQVSFTPSVSQIGSAPTIMGETKASGSDSFAGMTVAPQSRSALTTELTTDAGYVSGQGAVAK